MPFDELFPRILLNLKLILDLFSFIITHFHLMLLHVVLTLSDFPHLNAFVRWCLSCLSELGRS